jgi:hypothetical protein
MTLAAIAYPLVASAQHRARVSRGLQAVLATGGDAQVIYEGPQAEVDRLAASYGLRVTKRLQSGAVFSGHHTAIEALAQDRVVVYLSEDERVLGMNKITTQSNG